MTRMGLRLVRFLRTPRTALFGALAFASAGTAQDYGGLGGVALLFVVAVAAGPPLLSLAEAKLATWPDRRVTLATIGLLGIATLAFAIVYPRANVHSTTAGSDRDEDADIAVHRLLDGKYPYHAHTYLGNPITHLPGSIFLAVPFVLIGWSALQNIFWLPSFAVGTRRLFHDGRVTLIALALVLVTPAVLRELVTGGDLISNAIYVLLLTLLTLRLPASRPVLRVGTALLLGVALSSRANFLFVVPLLAVAIAREDGLLEATRLVMAAAASFLAVTLPFYFHDPDGFTPRSTEYRLSEFNDVLPHAAAVTVAVAIAATIALCATRMARDGIALCRNAALVQGLFVVVPVALASIRAGRPDFSFLVSGYGVPLVFFAVVGTWRQLQRS